MKKILLFPLFFVLSAFFIGQYQCHANTDTIICVDGKLLEMPDRIHQKLFDAAVNTGVPRAKKILQQAINDVNPNANLKIDGNIGVASRTAMCGMSETAILDAFVRNQSNFYKGIVARRPSQQKFLKGWLRRAAWLPEPNK